MVPISSVTVYVDPLDGSREFVEGRVENCQCLIGISVNGTPVGGVMNAPFFHLAYGLVPHAPVISNPFIKPFNGKTSIVTTDLTNVRVGMSGDRKSKPLMEVMSTLSELGCKVDEVGGAGNKAMRLLTGEYDVVIFNFKTSLWDTCATSAVVTAAGGTVTDLYGDPIDHTEPSTEEGMGNKRGVMMSRPGVPHAALADMFSSLPSVSELRASLEPPYCSEALTGDETVSQPTYLCLTCCPPTPGGANLCFCPACVQKCHPECDVMFVGNVESNCDCRNGGFCKIVATSGEAAGRLKEVCKGRPKCCYSDVDEKGGGGRLETFRAFQVTDVPKEIKECCKRLVGVTKDTHWIPAHRCGDMNQGLECPLESFAAQVFKFHVNRLQGEGKIAGEINPETSGAEWWVQVKDTSGSNSKTAIDIHYDKDEQLASDFCLGSFPLFSTVTYLTAAPKSNPTVIFDHTYEEPEDKPVEEIAVSYPEEGKQVIFDGRLLHGAPTNEALKSALRVTGGEDAMTEGYEEVEHRITFIVNIWINSRPYIYELTDEERSAVGHTGLCSGLEFVETRVACLEDGETVKEGEKVRLHFVTGGSTWGEWEEDEGEEGEGEEEGGMDGLVLEMAPMMLNEHQTAKVAFKNIENCPRLVYLGGE